MNQPQPFKTFDDQIKILKSRGLTIDNDDIVKNILSRENYYNIINGYKHPFLDHSSSMEKYIQNCNFNELYSLYNFDRSIRSIIFKPLLQLENELRTQIAYVFSESHQENNYLCYDNFETLKYTNNEKAISERATKIYSLLSKIQADISRAIKHKDYINHNIVKYGYIPLWVLVNTLPLNRLSSFFRLMNQVERIKVSMHWNVLEKDLSRYIELLAYFRNLCAHDERIYCSKGNIYISDTSVHDSLGIPRLPDGNYICGKIDLFALLITFKILLNKKDFTTVFNKINGRLISLERDLHCIPIETILLAMGFPSNWRDIKSI